MVMAKRKTMLTAERKLEMTAVSHGKVQQFIDPFIHPDLIPQRTL